MRVTSTSLPETEAAARAVLEQLLKPEARATVLGLVGDLGSGKTTFVQALARTLGIKEPVTSPTFVIEKFYNLTRGHWQRLVHVDAYRLNKPEELARLGFAELVADPGNLIVVEWAERVEILLPPDYQRVSFKFIDEDTREISFA